MTDGLALTDLQAVVSKRTSVRTQCVSREANTNHVVPRSRQLSKAHLHLPHRSKDSYLRFPGSELTSCLLQLPMKILGQSLIRQQRGRGTHIADLTAPLRYPIRLTRSVAVMRSHEGVGHKPSPGIADALQEEVRVLLAVRAWACS